MASAKTPRRVTVEVTPEDITRAHINDSYKCVVAQAVARTVKTATNIDVDTQSVRFTVDGERRIYLTPYAVQGYIVAFDAGEEISPFSFQLRDPKIKHRRVLTEEGKAATNAAQRVRRAAAKKEPAEVKDDYDEFAEKVRAQAKAAYEEARTAHPGPTHKRVSGSGGGPPRVFKKKRRAYGQRLLKINRLPGDMAQHRW